MQTILLASWFAVFAALASGAEAESSPAHYIDLTRHFARFYDETAGVGADVIAQIHEPDQLTPFLAHEMFHVENGKYFKDCEQVWCALWAEGLATYAAKVMNPGATDKQLLLTVPRPIRPAVEANWPAAPCFTRARLFSAKSEDVEALFIGGSGSKEFPDRFGYYVGLRILEELGGEYKLPELAQMAPERARATLTTGIDRLITKAGGCK